MNILSSIAGIINRYFGVYFESLPEFYLKNFSVLVQGLISNEYDSISKIASCPLNSMSHSTLTRFLSSYEEFWKELEKVFQETVQGDDVKHRILIADDSLLEKRGKHIPYVSKAYDHCTGHFKNAQTILTIGESSKGRFHPRDILFSEFTDKDRGKQQNSRNEMLVNWLRDNKQENTILVADSWYTNSYLIEACNLWFDSSFIGMMKGNRILKLSEEEDEKKISELVNSVPLYRKTFVRGQRIKYHSFEVLAKSIRHPVKIVVTELENGNRAALVSSNVNLSSEDIITYYSRRWSIEVFFKFAKQNLGLGKCHLRSLSGQRHYMILVSIAYLVVNDLKEYIRDKAKPKETFDFFVFLKMALSVMISMKCDMAVKSFNLLNDDVSQFLCRSPDLLHSPLLSRTS